MSIFIPPPTGPKDTLLLHPQGYPVYIDVPQCHQAGAVTFMRFKLPLKAHNFPLRHLQEQKFIVALQGELEIRTGTKVVSILKQGQAVIIPPGKQHRISQSGVDSSEVGIILKPGIIENAFRELAALIRVKGYSRKLISDHLANFNVVWDNGKLNNSEEYTIPSVSYSKIAQSLAEEIDESLINVWTWRTTNQG